MSLNADGKTAAMASLWQQLADCSMWPKQSIIIWRRRRKYIAWIMSFLFCVCIIFLSVSLLDISRTLIINCRWPAAIGLVPLWQTAKYV